MTEHTPGKWQVNFDEFAIKVECDEGVYREICRLNGNFAMSERRANAHLIARAPDMEAEIAEKDATITKLHIAAQNAAGLLSHLAGTFLKTDSDREWINRELVALERVIDELEGKPKATR